jgi:HD-like signal output (HDOD) protein
MSNSPLYSGDLPSEYGLLVLQAERPEQQVYARYLMLILNYRFGLDLITVKSHMEAFSAARKYGRKIRCTVIVQDTKIGTKSTIAALNLEDAIPLIVVLPAELIASHQDLIQRMTNVHFCAWETALEKSKSALLPLILKTFAANGIGELFGEDAQQLPFEEMRARVERRLRNLKTLPTLPEVAVRIMTMIQDPRPTVEDLEEVLTSDAAIVHKLLQVVNSPVFAGSGHKGSWSLGEAIVRLGRDKVGAIAQQIKMMNSLVKPEQSLFDLRRFWEHSVGCALVADRLYRDKLLNFKEEIEFNDYWIGGLMHDSGKVVLGFFFWEHFEEILTHIAKEECSFRQAEKDLCDVANHEFLGQLLLIKSNVGEQLVRAVGEHHSGSKDPSDLVCLLHVANNLCKDLGKGYLKEEGSLYRVEVLQKLGITREDMERIQQELGEQMVKEIDDLVDRCVQPV